MKIQLKEKFEDIISVENLLLAWQEFIKGKRGKPDVQKFSLNLIDNILQLHEELANKTYQHGGYHAFNISDPKPRNIHKASVRDRFLHHAIYRKLYPFFDRTFIANSFSCRKNKGTHKAINRFRALAWEASQNQTKTVWVLKCDIKKFFANIDHATLLGILRKYISTPSSSPPYHRFDLAQGDPEPSRMGQGGERVGMGLPLGNLTSQLFVNIYMNEFDRFVKHRIKAKYYTR